MTHPHRQLPNRTRSAWTLIEMMIVLAMIGVITAFAIPRVNLSSYRTDAAAQQVRSVFQTAQRTSLTRQYDVIVSIDTLKVGLQIAEDRNNNGVIEPSLGETRFWRPPGEGNRFAVPPIGVNSPTVSSPVVGANIKIISSLPSIIFHRDGSASSDAEIYMSSTYKGRTDFRAVTLTRSTGRAELYRLSGTGTSAKWIQGSL